MFFSHGSFGHLEGVPQQPDGAIHVASKGPKKTHGGFLSLLVRKVNFFEADGNATNGCERSCPQVSGSFCYLAVGNGGF